MQRHIDDDHSGYDNEVESGPDGWLGVARAGNGRGHVGGRMQARMKAPAHVQAASVLGSRSRNCRCRGWSTKWAVATCSCGCGGWQQRRSCRHCVEPSFFYAFLTHSFRRGSSSPLPPPSTFRIVRCNAVALYIDATLYRACATLPICAAAGLRIARANF